MRKQIDSFLIRHSGLLPGREEPDSVLTEYVRISPQGAALDLGCGVGRHSIYLATLGYDVQAVDASESALEACRERAKVAGVKLETSAQDIREFPIVPSKYAVIVCTYALYALNAPEIASVASSLQDGLCDNGLLYCADFSIDDPMLKRIEAQAQRVDAQTFYMPSTETYRHFFAVGEFDSLFSGLKTLYKASGQRIDTEHGDEHYHGFVQYLGQRRRDA